MVMKSVSWTDNQQMHDPWTSQKSLSSNAPIFSPRDVAPCPPGLYSDAENAQRYTNTLQQTPRRTPILTQRSPHSQSWPGSPSFSPYGSPNARRSVYPDSSCTSVTPTKPQYPAMPTPMSSSSVPPGYAPISNSSYAARRQAMYLAPIAQVSNYHRSKQDACRSPAPFISEVDQSLFASSNYRRKDVIHDTKPRPLFDGYIYHVRRMSTCIECLYIMIHVMTILTMLSYPIPRSIYR